jgi:hypothetical protein
MIFPCQHNYVVKRDKSSISLKSVTKLWLCLDGSVIIRHSIAVNSRFINTQHKIKQNHNFLVILVDHFKNSLSCTCN